MEKASIQVAMSVDAALVLFWSFNEVAVKEQLCLRFLSGEVC